MDLIGFIREETDMAVGVAAFPELHPRSPHRRSDRRHLADKLALADFGITQFFFDADHYRRMGWSTSWASSAATRRYCPG